MQWSLWSGLVWPGLLWSGLVWSLPRAAEAASCCWRAACRAGPGLSWWCCWAGWAGAAPPGLVARPGSSPRLLRMTLLPSRAAVLAACTTSLGWAFLHSTCRQEKHDQSVSLSWCSVRQTFLFLIVWKCISQTLSTVSSFSNVTKPNPRCRLVCWSINMTASSTFPDNKNHSSV